MLPSSLSALARHANHQTTFVLHDDLTKRFFFWQAASSVIFLLQHQAEEAKPYGWAMFLQYWSRFRSISGFFPLASPSVRQFQDQGQHFAITSVVVFSARSFPILQYCIRGLHTLEVSTQPPPVFSQNDVSDISSAVEWLHCSGNSHFQWSHRHENSRKCCFRLWPVNG